MMLLMKPFLYISVIDKLKGEIKYEKKHYNGINALRTIGCIGIVMMHMAANNNYIINGFIYKK